MRLPDPYSGSSDRSSFAKVAMKGIPSIRGILDEKGTHGLTVSSETRVFDGLCRKAGHEGGALVVLENGHPIGMFSKRDYARLVILQGKPSRQIPVGEVMQTPVLAVHPEQTIDECLSFRTYRHVRHLPVPEDDRRVGLVSIGDKVKGFITAQDETIHPLENYIGGKYPA